MLAPYRLGDLGVFCTLRSLEVRGVPSIESCNNPKCFKHWVDLSKLRIDKHPWHSDRGVLTEAIWQVWTGLNHMSRIGLVRGDWTESSRGVLSEVTGPDWTGLSLWVEALT